MMKIGQFSQTTGISVKALRHYDEIGLLIPAETDPFTGYRMYAESQVRTGAIIAVLRRAGVPVPEVRAALAGSDPAGVLTEHAEQVAKRRADEDAALQSAQTAMALYCQPVEVIERLAAAQPFAGRTIEWPVDADDDEVLDDETAGRVAEELYGQLTAAGARPTGAFWTELAETDRDQLAATCCWAIETPLPAGWGGADVVCGVLPERLELVARMPATAEELPEGVMHPAAVALFEALAARGLEPVDESVRQQVRYDLPEPILEIAATIGDAAGAAAGPA